jgi:hypothetical protein
MTAISIFSLASERAENLRKLSLVRIDQTVDIVVNE